MEGLSGESVMQVSIPFRQCLTDNIVSDNYAKKELRAQQDQIARNNSYIKAAECVARIADPLWKKVCNDLIYNMGPSFCF